VRGLARRFRAWWDRGLAPGSNPDPDEVRRMREWERAIGMWRI